MRRKHCDHKSTHWSDSATGQIMLFYATNFLAICYLEWIGVTVIMKMTFCLDVLNCIHWLRWPTIGWSNIEVQLTANCGFSSPWGWDSKESPAACVTWSNFLNSLNHNHSVFTMGMIIVLKSRYCENLRRCTERSLCWVQGSWVPVVRDFSVILRRAL